MAHVGSCFCGAVRLEVSGDPEAMGYCHCRSCRSWSGGPPLGLVDVYAATIPSLAFVPAVHVN